MDVEHRQTSKGNSGLPCGDLLLRFCACLNLVSTPRSATDPSAIRASPS
jgi:hypothetical protein